MRASKHWRPEAKGVGAMKGPGRRGNGGRGRMLRPEKSRPYCVVRNKLYLWEIMSETVGRKMYSILI